MQPTETVMLVRYVKALCPQQAIDTFTPDAWHDVIGHLDFTECRDAVRAVAARQPFIAPSEIIREIADRRCADMAQSNACRAGDCRNCGFSWCTHSCHPKAVAAIAGPQPALPPKAVERGGEPVALGEALKAFARDD